MTGPRSILLPDDDGHHSPEALRRVALDSEERIGGRLVRLQIRSLWSRLGSTHTDSGMVTEPQPEGAVAVTCAPPKRLSTQETPGFEYRRGIKYEVLNK